MRRGCEGLSGLDTRFEFHTTNHQNHSSETEPFDTHGHTQTFRAKHIRCRGLLYIAMDR